MKKKIEEITATGRRKRAVAAVRMRSGAGLVQINGLPFEKHFPLEIQRQAILAPFAKLGLEGNYDLLIRVSGGGVEGQSEAARLGIARALVKQDEARRGDLKALGYLTRDPRRRERKKYGRKGARKSFQYSKR